MYIHTHTYTEIHIYDDKYNNFTKIECYSTFEKFNKNCEIVHEYNFLDKYLEQRNRISNETVNSKI